MLSPTQADLPLCVCVCVCVSSKGWQIPSVNWIQDQSFTLITQWIIMRNWSAAHTHTHTHTLTSSGSMHAASIWERYITDSSSLHNRFILFFYSFHHSSLSLSQQVTDSTYVRQTYDWNHFRWGLL